MSELRRYPRCRPLGVLLTDSSSVSPFARPSRRRLDVREPFQAGFHHSAPPGPSVALARLNFLQATVGIVPERVARQEVLYEVLFRRAAVVADVATGRRDGRLRKGRRLTTTPHHTRDRTPLPDTR